MGTSRISVRDFTAAAAAAAILLSGCGSSANEEPYESADLLPVDPAVEEFLNTDPRFAEPPLDEEEFVTYCENLATAWRNAGLGDDLIQRYERGKCSFQEMFLNEMKIWFTISPGFYDNHALQLSLKDSISKQPEPDQCELHASLGTPDPEDLEISDADGNEYCMDTSYNVGWKVYFYDHSTQYTISLTIIQGPKDADERYKNETFLEAAMPAVFEAFPK